MQAYYTHSKGTENVLFCGNLSYHAFSAHNLSAVVIAHMPTLAQEADLIYSFSVTALS